MGDSPTDSPSSPTCLLFCLSVVGIDLRATSFCHVSGGSFVFLLSLKAGGTGLNLTSADTVIIYDPWWNPAVELQAADRTHRIGQTRPVNSMKLLVRDSIEEKILRLQEKKQDIFDNVIDKMCKCIYNRVGYLYAFCRKVYSILHS